MTQYFDNIIEEYSEEDKKAIEAVAYEEACGAWDTLYAEEYEDHIAWEEAQRKQKEDEEAIEAAAYEEAIGAWETYAQDSYYFWEDEQACAVSALEEAEQEKRQEEFLLAEIAQEEAERQRKEEGKFFNRSLRFIKSILKLAHTNS